MSSVGQAAGGVWLGSCAVIGGFPVLGVAVMA